MSKIKNSFIENKHVYFFNKKDPIFSSWFISKFINNLMSRGNKSKIENSLLKAFSFLKLKYKKKPLLLFFLVLQKIKPLLNIKVVEFGKKKFNIPYNLSMISQYKLAIKWLASSIQKRTEFSLEQKIIREFCSILDTNESELITKRNVLHFQAQRNKHLINFI